MTKLYMLLIPLVLTLVFQNAIAEQDWNNYWVKGKYYLSDLKLAFQVFKIQYRITGGEVENVEYKFASVIVKIKTETDGKLEFNIPRNLPFTNTGSEDDFPIILADGKEIQFQETKTGCYRMISIPFQNGTRNIELVGTMTLGSTPAFSIGVDPSCIIKPTPKDQIENGISRENVICKEGLELIVKSTNGNLACVKPTTAEKLLQRGWGILPLRGLPTHNP